MTTILKETALENSIIFNMLIALCMLFPEDKLYVLSLNSFDESLIF